MPTNHTGGEWCSCRRCQHLRQIAHLGGQEVVRRYGRGHLRELGRAGFAAAVAKRTKDGLPEATARSQVVTMLVGKGRLAPR